MKDRLELLNVGRDNSKMSWFYGLTNNREIIKTLEKCYELENHLIILIVISRSKLIRYIEKKLIMSGFYYSTSTNYCLNNTVLIQFAENSRLQKKDSLTILSNYEFRR